MKEDIRAAESTPSAKEIKSEESYASSASHQLILKETALSLMPKGIPPAEARL